MSEVTIYALCEPDTGEVHYIGQTRNGLDARLYQHLVTRGGNATKRAWLNGLEARQARPVIKTLAVVTADNALAVVTADNALAAEAAHIKAHVARGCPLTNTTHNPLATLPRRISYVEDLTYQTVVRLPDDVAAELQEVAKGLGLAPAVAARLLIIERLRELRKTQGADDRERA